MKIYYFQEEGFTLIELLVVISILAVIGDVVSASVFDLQLHL